jgi:ribose 5-phosphate isomerase B
MKIALANDHRGIKSMEHIKAIVIQLGHQAVDFTSATADQPTDYPDAAFEAGNAVSKGLADLGILVCGTGIGMCIAANKVKGIRAALCYDELAAKISREHNDANILCLSGDLLGPSMLQKIVQTWLTTEFSGGRHLRRIKKVKAIEDGLDPREMTGQ